MQQDQMKIQDGNTFKEFADDGRRVYHKSMGNDMSMIHKSVYYAVTLWANGINRTMARGMNTPNVIASK